jgi:adenylate cyclase class 2
MKEIEAKILEVNSADIQKQLLGLGAQKVFEGQMEWVVFDFPDGSLSKEEILVRLRKRGGQAELTVKKLLSLKGAKVSEETELPVNDFDTAKKILETIGLKQKQGYPLHKHRISYMLDNVHFEIDTFPQFPTYLEIEAPSKEVIKEYAQKLGFSQADLKPWGVREVFAHYRLKNKLH